MKLRRKKMKSPKRYLFLSVLLLLMLFLSACSGGNQTEQAQTGSEDQAPVAEEAASEETSAGEAAPQEGSAEEAPAEGDTGSESQTGGVPEDIPIMEGAYNMQITPDGTNISYRIDAEIEDVVTYYQEALASLGWEMTRSPDTMTASMGTMGRTNANGDRVTLSLQYNPKGLFTVLQMVVLRGD